MENILVMYSYDFMLRALVVGLFVSIIASLLGINLIFQKYSMIGDGLSHIGFGSISIAIALNIAPLYISLPIVTLSAIALLRIRNNSKINSDSMIALISTSSLALGVFILSITDGINTNINNYLFGSILGINNNEALLTIIISIIVLIIYILFYNRFFAISFDENFAISTGVNINLIKTLLATLSAIIIVIGMKIMGSLLISSLIVMPGLSATRISKNYRMVNIVSVIISVFCLVFGISLSYIFSSPTGATIVLCNLLVFIILFIYSKINRIHE